MPKALLSRLKSTVARFTSSQMGNGGNRKALLPEEDATVWPLIPYGDKLEPPPIHSDPGSQTIWELVIQRGKLAGVLAVGALPLAVTLYLYYFLLLSTGSGLKVMGLFLGIVVLFSLIAWAMTSYWHHKWYPGRLRPTRWASVFRAMTLLCCIVGVLPMLAHLRNILFPQVPVDAPVGQEVIGPRTARAWSVVTLLLLGLPLVLGPIPTMVERGNFINFFGIFTLKPAEFASITLILALAHISLMILARAGLVVSTTGPVPLDVVPYMRMGKTLSSSKDWWAKLDPYWPVVILLVALAAAIVGIVAPGSALTRGCIGGVLLVLLVAPLLHWTRKQDSYWRALGEFAVGLAMLMSMLFVMFMKSKDLGPFMVLGFTSVLMITFVLVASPAWAYGSRPYPLDRNSERRGLGLILMAGAFLGLASLATAMAPDFFVDTNMEVLERARQRAQCYLTPERYDHCEQLVRSVHLFALEADGRVPFVPNMHSDLAFSSIRGMFGGKVLWCVLGSLIALSLLLVRAGQVSRNTLVHYWHSVHDAAKERKVDAPDGGSREKNLLAWRSHLLVAVLFGLAVLLLAQTIVHINSSLSLFMMTGVTLPFLSAGGGSVMAWMLTAGLILVCLVELAFIRNRMKESD